MRRAEHEETLLIPAGRRELEGQLRLPADATGLVLFAHGQRQLFTLQAQGYKQVERSRSSGTLGARS